MIAKRCVMKLIVTNLLFLPFYEYVRYCSTFNFCLFDLHSIKTPFVTGFFFSLKNLRNRPGRHRSVAYIQSAAIALHITDNPVFCDWRGRSKSITGIHQRDPKLVDNPNGGMPLNKEGILCMEDILYTAPSPA